MFSFYTLWKCGYRKETLIWNGLKGYHNCTASFSRVWLRLFQTLLMVILGLRDGENSDNVSGSGEAYRTFFGQSLHKSIIIINHIIIKYQIYSDSETKGWSPITLLFYETSVNVRECLRALKNALEESSFCLIESPLKVMKIFFISS